MRWMGNMHGVEQVHSGLYFGDGLGDPPPRLAAICIYFLYRSVLRKSSQK